jgi:hypothetical protein
MASDKQIAVNRLNTKTSTGIAITPNKTELLRPINFQRTIGPLRN